MRRGRGSFTAAKVPNKGQRGWSLSSGPANGVVHADPHSPCAPAAPRGVHPSVIRTETFAVEQKISAGTFSLGTAPARCVGYLTGGRQPHGTLLGLGRGGRPGIRSGGAATGGVHRHATPSPGTCLSGGGGGGGGEGVQGGGVPPLPAGMKIKASPCPSPPCSRPPRGSVAGWSPYAGQHPSMLPPWRRPPAGTRPPGTLGAPPPPRQLRFPRTGGGGGGLAQGLGGWLGARGGGAGGNFGTPPILAQGHQTPETSTPPNPRVLVDTQLCDTLVGPDFEQCRLIRGKEKGGGEQGPGRLSNFHNPPHPLQRPRSRKCPRLRENIPWGKVQHRTEKQDCPPQNCPHETPPPPRPLGLPQPPQTNRWTPSLAGGPSPPAPRPLSLPQPPQTNRRTPSLAGPPHT